jgi:hypothetical protein
MELISFLYKVQKEGKEYARADVTVQGEAGNLLRMNPDI